MNRVTAGMVGVGLLLVFSVLGAGCGKSYCDTGDSARADTEDTSYLASRRRAPDSGWRVRLSR